MNYIFLLLLFIFPIHISAECTCEQPRDTNEHINNQALKFKLIAIATIIVAGAIGICIPLLGMMFKSLGPNSNMFLVVKFFAAGVILATGFVHVFPDANESLENPCLVDKAWGDFPMANFVAMLAAVAVMMIETVVTSLFNKFRRDNKTVECVEDEERHESRMHVHTHTHGSSEILFRHRIVSQVKI